MPHVYDYHFLEDMRQIYEATQQYPLNPRDLSIRNAFLSDRVFLQEFNLHMNWIRHFEDMKRKT